MNPLTARGPQSQHPDLVRILIQIILIQFITLNQNCSRNLGDHLKPRMKTWETREKTAQFLFIGVSAEDQSGHFAPCMLLICSPDNAILLISSARERMLWEIRQFPQGHVTQPNGNTWGFDPGLSGFFSPHHVACKRLPCRDMFLLPPDLFRKTQRGAGLLACF